MTNSTDITGNSKNRSKEVLIAEIPARITIKPVDMARQT